jgi:protein-disulfide isomerase
VDDDAVKGNLETAKVVVVEFSDYECPFCQSFFNETLPSIQSTYIDSGEVAFIYRDLPLSFHEPAASLAANIMECTRAQGGDSAYYQMHDYWFQNSISNGSGLRVPDSYVAFADSIGLSGSQVKSCADAATYADEIAADSAAAASVGIQGTPGFVVGVMDADGNVTGDFINGAYPFATFQTTIDKYLNQ